MISSDQIDKVIKKGLDRFVRALDKQLIRVQVSFSINHLKNVQYVINVDLKPVHTVSLNQLIGSNIYNGIVEKRIKQMLEKYISDNPDHQNVNILAGIMDGNTVYYHLKSGTELIRVVEPYELIA